MVTSQQRNIRNHNRRTVTALRSVGKHPQDRISLKNITKINVQQVVQIGQRFLGIDMTDDGCNRGLKIEDVGKGMLV